MHSVKHPVKQSVSSSVHKPAPQSVKFADLALAEPILRALSEEGYVSATPIQAQAIPLGLDGRDVLGCAQTGTGKTAAFALPILHRLVAQPAPQGPRRARCLVLCPTRELATQIGDSFRAYGRHLPLRHTVIFGGVNQNGQAEALRRGVDVVVATPGRLLDLMNQGLVDLRGIGVLVLDEADRMLDMGFINDIRKIVARLPRQRQTMLFSATMPAEIRKLADTLLHQPATVQVAPVAATADRIEQSVYFVDRGNKPDLLAHLFDSLPMSRAIVFTRTKHGADRVVRRLSQRGIRAEAIHGNKSQNARQRALDNFKSGRTSLLIATDIAARGIDVDDVSHVVNYDLTHEPETYVHRIGRTARAGASGVAISFCDQDERENLRAIQTLIRRDIPVCDEMPLFGEREAAPRRDGAVAPRSADAPRAPLRRDVVKRHAPAGPQSHSAARPREARHHAPSIQPARPVQRDGHRGFPKLGKSKRAKPSRRWGRH